jgi:hypothetical protein
VCLDVMGASIFGIPFTSIVFLEGHRQASHHRQRHHMLWEMWEQSLVATSGTTKKSSAGLRVIHWHRCRPPFCTWYPNPRVVRTNRRFGDVAQKRGLFHPSSLLIMGVLSILGGLERRPDNWWRCLQSILDL